MNRTIVATAAILSVLLAGDAGAARYAPTVGTWHSDFTLPNIADGKPVSLSDFRGKKVLLIQFASW